MLVSSKIALTQSRHTEKRVPLDRTFFLNAIYVIVNYIKLKIEIMKIIFVTILIDSK